MNLSTFRRRLCLVAALWCLGAALPALAQTTPAPAAAFDEKLVAPGFAGLSAQDRIALMPVDVELFSLSAGGIPEPRADWTAAAQGFMKTEVEARARALNMDTVLVTEQDADDFAEQVGLHAAVAQAVSLHHAVGGMWTLPTKRGKLDWSFGDAMKPLAQKTGARYGLFLWVRDSYASAERKMMMVGLAMLGIGVTGGMQVGYASLIDLDSGRLVWFRRLARGTGDLREAKSATETIDSLLTGLPIAR